MTPDEPVHYPNEYEHCDLPGCVYYACVECSEDWPCSVTRAAIEGDE